MGGVLRGVRDAVQAMRVTGSQPALPADASAELAGNADAPTLADVRAILLQVREGQYRAARQVETVQRGQEEILEFVRSVLDDEALAAGGGAAHRRRVAAVSLRVTRSTQVVRGLAEAFCDGIGLEIILSAEPGAGGRGPYFCWRPADGRRLEDALAAVLAAAPDDRAADTPGLDELRRLVLALHEYGPGTIRIGPLILNSAQEALIGRVVAPWDLAVLGATSLPGWAALAESRGSADTTWAWELASGGAAARAAKEAEQWLRELGNQRIPGDRAVVELTAWARGYLGLTGAADIAPPRRRAMK
jgi:hypothetical protein